MSDTKTPEIDYHGKATGFVDYAGESLNTDMSGESVLVMAVDIDSSLKDYAFYVNVSEIERLLTKYKEFTPEQLKEMYVVSWTKIKKFMGERASLDSEELALQEQYLFLSCVNWYVGRNLIFGTKIPIAIVNSAAEATSEISV